MPCSTSFSTWPLTFYHWLQFSLWPGILKVTNNLVKTPPCPYLSIIKYSLLSHAKKKNAPQLLLEKEMATHSSILAWRIPWTEEPGGLQSMGSQRVGHDWSDSFNALCSVCKLLHNLQYNHACMIPLSFKIHSKKRKPRLQSVSQSVTLFSLYSSLVKCLSSLHISSWKAHPPSSSAPSSQLVTTFFEFCGHLYLSSVSVHIVSQCTSDTVYINSLYLLLLLHFAVIN